MDDWGEKKRLINIIIQDPGIISPSNRQHDYDSICLLHIHTPICSKRVTSCRTLVFEAEAWCPVLTPAERSTELMSRFMANDKLWWRNFVIP
jgi:hypothetical protein